jgi:hypothetical protein
VTAVNDLLGDQPGLLNKSPEEDGATISLFKKIPTFKPNSQVGFAKSSSQTPWKLKNSSPRRPISNSFTKHIRVKKFDLCVDITLLVFAIIHLDYAVSISFALLGKLNRYLAIYYAVGF